MYVSKTCVYTEGGRERGREIYMVTPGKGEHIYIYLSIDNWAGRLQNRKCKDKIEMEININIQKNRYR